MSYIITPGECRAFLRLTNDEDRDTFIQQFWQRRNPDPDAQDNTFKSEHYRRIVYSNVHFSSKASDGWKTDRGRIYIQWGPPDEIQSNQINEYGSLEEWRYRYLEGIGENVLLGFADPDLAGDYRLVLQPQQKSGRFQPDDLDGTEATKTTYWIPSRLEPETEEGSNLAPSFQPLESALVERADLSDVHFSDQFDSVPATPFTTLVSMTIKTPAFEFRSQLGTLDQKVQLNMVLHIIDSSGRVVEDFADAVPEVADAQGVQDSELPCILQRNIALRPGSYDVAIALGNPESGDIGTAYAELTVAPMEDSK